MDRKKAAIASCACCIMAAFAGPSGAGQLIYLPINPGFGGYSNNYTYLQGLATAQNLFQYSGSSGAPLIQFPDFSINLGGTTSGTSGTTSTSGGGSTSTTSESLLGAGTRVSN